VEARFSARPDRPWGSPSLLYNGYRVFPGGKVLPGRAADHSTPSSAEVLEKQSCTSTPFWATTGPVTGLLYHILIILEITNKMRPCIRIYYSNVSYCSTYFERYIAHHQELKNCICSLWFYVSLWLPAADSGRH
jgi:hypothetical protein